jgi:hypothetical protein
MTHENQQISLNSEETVFAFYRLGRPPFFNNERGYYFMSRFSSMTSSCWHQQLFEFPSRVNLLFFVVSLSAAEFVCARFLFLMTSMDIDSGLLIGNSTFKGKGKQIDLGEKDNLPW